MVSLTKEFPPLQADSDFEDSEIFENNIRMAVTEIFVASFCRMAVFMLWLQKDESITRNSVVGWLILNTVFILIGFMYNWAHLLKGLLHILVNCGIGFTMYKYISLLSKNDTESSEQDDDFKKLI
jgi:hypothetical protein